MVQPERMRRTKSRTNGEGSIFKLQDGRWRAVVTVGVVDGKQRRRSRTERTQADARAALEELRRENGGGVSDISITVRQWLARWVDGLAASGLRPATIDLYRGSAKNYVVPYLGSKRIASVKPLDIQAWLSQLRADEVGTRSQQVAYNTLRTAMAAAVRMQVVATNPVAVCSRPQHIAKKIDPFTEAEAGRILKKARGTDIAIACELGLYLGIREGELFGLRWIDWDAKTLTLSVVQQAVESGEDRFAEPKTRSAKRKIKVSPNVAAALMEQRAHQMRAGLAHCELVFSGPRGEAWMRSNFQQRRWNPMLKSLKIRHRGYHHCRHTAATHMLAAGVPVATVAHILGHANPSITQRIYSHYLPAHGDQAAAAMQSLYG
jgi:integrase